MLLLMILTLLVILATAAAIMLLIVDCYRSVLQYRSPHDDTEEYHADNDDSKPAFSWHALLGDMFGALAFTLLLLFVFRLLCCHFLNISNGQTTRERLDSNKHQRKNHRLEHQSCGQHWRAVVAASFGCPPPLSFPIASSEGCTMIDTEQHQNT
jgi:hypothetical protein